tara:strand:+ start:19744 stop:20055 length:312 start_codon:yes stop_codon:yes gene_type:complete
MTEKQVAKRTRKRKVPRKTPGDHVDTPKPKTVKKAKKTESELRPGDGVEFAITAEVKSEGRTFWVKVGANTEVQDGEAGPEAYARVEDFAETNLAAKVQDILK